MSIGRHEERRAEQQESHYKVQKRRRESLLAEWKSYHKTVIKRADVVMHDDPVRRMRRGAFVGRDGDRPTMNLDASIHEIGAHTTSTIHRHSWDAQLFIVEGSGWSEIDGKRYDWKAGDAVQIPPKMTRHEHFNPSDDHTRTLRIEYGIRYFYEQLWPGYFKVEHRETMVARP